MKVVVYQLRIDTSEAVMRQLKAAKALLAIMPLLGITFVITVITIDPSLDQETQLGWVIFMHARAFLLSTQGFLITLPYCFLNTEVRTIIKQRWERRRASRRCGQNRNGRTSNGNNVFGERSGVHRDSKTGQRGDGGGVVFARRNPPLCSDTHGGRPSLHSVPTKETTVTTGSEFDSLVALSSQNPDAHAERGMTPGVPEEMFPLMPLPANGHTDSRDESNGTVKFYQGHPDLITTSMANPE